LIEDIGGNDHNPPPERAFKDEENHPGSGNGKMTNLLLYSGVTVFLFMILVFVIASLKKDNSIVDIAWGLGFACVVFLTLLLSRKPEGRQILVSILVVIWGIRLAVHIALRKRGKGEDWRYARWRQEWKRWFFLRSFLQIYTLQGIFLLIIVYPVLLISSSSFERFTALDIAGTAVWLVGFIFEAVGDYQLVQFKGNPDNRGLIMTEGLWRYTRHPNYFGETAMWWGILLISLSIPFGWTAIVSPLLITVLLLKISGVSMLEKKYAENDRFKEYAKITSAFFPWFPKTKNAQNRNA
jgi:steroid 5-alpha reductase family enzyme